MSAVRISHPTSCLHGTIRLSGSKSISNRVLLIQAISGKEFEVTNLSDSDDTLILTSLLDSQDEILDAGHAGTTFRFLTSLLAFSGKRRMLTGSSRMKQRPIRTLVEALKTLGASIGYAEEEGFPPLWFDKPSSGQFEGEVSLDAGISSQFISSLMMVGPYLPGGLVIHLEGDIVSAPYIEMTQKIMSYFGAESRWEHHSIVIPPAEYNPIPFFVEADWSAASYYYSLAALSHEADITLLGLFENSVQGDAVIQKIGSSFGVQTEFIEGGIRIRKENGATPSPFFEHDFIEHPDLAQSVLVMMGGLGCQGLITGLQTLKIKETDRIQALQNELAKMHVFLSGVPARFSQKTTKEMYMLEGKAEAEEIPFINTYQDHRMAMSFAGLSVKFPVLIENPAVVSKSYPRFWEDMQMLGFQIEDI